MFAAELMHDDHFSGCVNKILITPIQILTPFKIKIEKRYTKNGALYLHMLHYCLVLHNFAEKFDG
jgi:hypothetical protein